MTGVTTQVFAISRITLALFEDSGWYRVNYENAEGMNFGKGLGCEFAKQSCLTWIKRHPENPYPFCNILGDARCTRDRKAKVRCNLHSKERDVPSEFDYNVDHVYMDTSGNEVRGYGNVELADFCPYYRVYTDNSKEDSDTRCTYPQNMNYINYSLEVVSVRPAFTYQPRFQVFSPTARCVDLDGGLNVKNEFGSSTWTHTTGCYETTCEKNLLYIKTQKSKFYPCYGEGQLIHIKKRLHGIGTVSTRIVCPPCAEICGEQNCAPERAIAKLIGDEHYESSCESFSVALSLIFLTSFFLVTA